jgi:hypothetical protein
MFAAIIGWPSIATAIHFKDAPLNKASDGGTDFLLSERRNELGYVVGRSVGATKRKYR